MYPFTAEESERLRALMVPKNITPSFDELTKAVNRSKAIGLSIARKENKILRLISQDKNITIKACDEKALANTKEKFLVNVVCDFKNWGLDNSSVATVETVADVYELIKNATFSQMFNSFGVDLDKLCVTQSQIKDFCVDNTQWLGPNYYGIFFLFRKDEKKAATPDNVFVAIVRLRSVGLKVCVCHFKNDDVWNAVDHHLVVLPQLTV